MNRLILWLMFCAVSLGAWAQEGVRFESLTYEEALAKAKAENKAVFVDCYTTWCGPCKYMSEKIFPQAKMGEFFNPKFVCVKFDMEKEEGKQFGQKFSVASYPTFFIIGADGKLLHKVVGGCEADEFIERVQEGLGDASLSKWEEEYDAGNRDKGFLTQYLRVLKEYQERAKVQVVMDELLSVLSDKEKVSADYWFIFGDPQWCTPDSKMFVYLSAHRKEFYAANGKEAVDKLFTEPLTAEILWLMEGVQPEGSKRLKEIRKQIKKLKPTNEPVLLATVEIANAVQTMGIDELLDVCEREIPTLTKDPEISVWSVFRLAGAFIQYQSGPLSKASDEQKARWEEMIQLKRN